MDISKIRDLVYCFALGDALGAAFEFKNPSEKEVNEKLFGDEKISFTDDTKLLLTTIGALKFYDDDKHLIEWKGFKKETIKALNAWYLSYDLRGVGNVTYQALKQIERAWLDGQDESTFRLNVERGYDSKMSSGNGSLSRALPLCALGIEMCEEYKDWIKITHYQDYNVQAVDNLKRFLKNGADLFYSNPGVGDQKGFFCFDALEIAIAAQTALDAYHVFRRCMVPYGDNDSTAAIALGIWALHADSFEAKEFIEKQRSRFVPGDLKEIEVALGKRGI